MWVCGVEGSGARSIAAILGQIPGVTCHIIRAGAPSSALPNLCVLVASAEQGISPAPLAAWLACAEEFVPRVCVWTHIDSGRADDDEMRAIAERMLDEDVLPLALPIADDDEEFVAVLDLPGQKLHVGDSAAAQPADPEHISLSGDLRDELLAAAAATADDDLAIEQMQLHLLLDEQRAWALAVAAVATGQLALAVPVDAAHMVGTRILATFAADTIARSASAR